MNRWQCHRLTAALVDYVDGSLQAARRQAVETHLAQCADCAAAVAALQEVPATLQALPERLPDEATLAAQRAAIRAAIATVEPPRAGWRRRWLALDWSWPELRLPAAAVASGLLAVSLLFMFALPRGPQRVPVAALDDATLVDVQELTHALSTHDEGFPSVSHEVSMLMPLAISDDDGDGLDETIDGLPDDDLERVHDLLDEVS